MEHAITEIVRGRSYRRDLDDLDELCESIQDRGLLAPPSVTEESVLIAGERRLAAMERLGYRVTPVWVVHGVSDRLAEVLAIRDEQTLRKALKPIEQAELYEELKQLYAEEAERRDAATRFGSDERTSHLDTGEEDGGADSAPPPRGNDGKARVQAAKAVTGRDSRTMLEQVSELKRIAADDDEDPMVRQHAAEALIELNEDGKVNGRHQKVKAAQARARLVRWAEHPDTPDPVRAAAEDELAALQADLPVAELAKEAGLAVDRVAKLETVTSTERVGWADVDPLMRQKHAVRKLVDLLRREHGWWERFDAAEIGQYADEAQWDLITSYLTGAEAFITAATTARETTAPADPTEDLENQSQKAEDVEVAGEDEDGSGEDDEAAAVADAPADEDEGVSDGGA
ncbi:ParB/RepB/Spo0J family partition protein [Kocuria carniphila]|uniref:ParB/RepB/Spo0J family partition protein n=1 Tax=Kocuria carniphila TaxID=262208 RepID=A0ABV3V503_9MICC